METYITVMQSPRYEQMSFDDFLFNAEVKPSIFVNHNESNTKTYKVEQVSEVFSKMFDIDALIARLLTFNQKYEGLRAQPRENLFYTFHIPKKSGGLRRIDAPNDDLMDALRELKGIFENDFHALYHTSAFAYIKHRSTLDAVKRHTANQSRWYAKYDLSNFFGSTTIDFVLKMFSMVYPFSEVMKDELGKQELTKALELAFLNGGLPQGTPISPIITNIMMIPIDFKLYNTLRNYNGQCFTYTRYADDFIISARKGFSFRNIEKFLISVIESFGAPFNINPGKTRYGSNTGRNWNLGVMVISDNHITVGYKKKKQFQSMLVAYITDKKNGKTWERTDLQVLDGYRNYYRMVEGETIDRIVKHIADKNGVKTIKCSNGVNLEMLKDDLKAAGILSHTHIT